MKDTGKVFELLENRHLKSEKTDLRALVERTSVNLCNRAFQNIGPLSFTDHGPSHSLRVLEATLDFLRVFIDFHGPVSPLDAVAAASAAYLHDLGMARWAMMYSDPMSYEKGAAKVRHGHVPAVVDSLKRNRAVLTDLYDWEVHLESILPWLCQAHGTDMHETACEQLSRMPLDGFHGVLLGKALLLADELDLSQERSLIGRTDDWKHLPTISLAHQFKHHYVTYVTTMIPKVTIYFAFPESCHEARPLFTRWIIQKLNRQIELVCKGLTGRDLEVFTLDIHADDDPIAVPREPCPKEVLDYVRKQVEHSPGPPIRIARRSVNQLLPDDFGERPKDSLSDAVDMLLEAFYRSCDTEDAVKRFEDVYVRVDRNEQVLSKLLNKLERHYNRTAGKGLHKSVDLTPFVITGGTGVGKSALVRRLAHDKVIIQQLRNRVPKLVIAIVNCHNMESVLQLLRRSLKALLIEIRERDGKLYKEITKTLDIDPIRAMKLSKGTAKDTLRAALGLIYDPKCRKPGRRSRKAYAVCLIFDNLDRAATIDAKIEAVRYALGASEAGSPFFVIPLRPSTKRQIEDRLDHFAAIATAEVYPPNPSDVLATRTRVAFEETTAHRGPEPWSKKDEMRKIMLDGGIEIESLQKAIERIVLVLAEKVPGVLRRGGGARHAPSGDLLGENQAGLVVRLAGTDIRSALGLFRAVVKSLVPKDFLRLANNMIGEHSLITRMMKEDKGLYYANVSKIRNLFDPRHSGCYWGKHYVLNHLREIQRGLAKDRYVPLDDWRGACIEVGIPEEVFEKEAWGLICGSLPLVEVESIDPNLPRDRVKRFADLPTNTKVQTTPREEFYLGWLVADISYLECVLEDTPMNCAMAETLAAKVREGKHRFLCCEEFLRFLQRFEDLERAQWNYRGESLPFAPELLARLARQHDDVLE